MFVCECVPIYIICFYGILNLCELFNVEVTFKQLYDFM